jgi:hypothetical protein
MPVFASYIMAKTKTYRLHHGKDLQEVQEEDKAW